MRSGIQWLDRLSTWRRGWLYLLFFGLTLLVGAADYLSGERYTVYVLYFPIVAASCWILGIRSAIIISLLGSTLWIIDDFLRLPAQRLICKNSGKPPLDL